VCGATRSLLSRSRRRRISTESTPIAGMTTRIGVDFRISAGCPRPCMGEDRGDSAGGTERGTWPFP
jgi:hypothetical protein